MAEVLVNENNEVLIEDNKAIQVPEPTKSWFYVTEYDSNGYFKAKTIGCSGDMPYDYMYGANNAYYYNIMPRFLQEFEINDSVTSIGSSAFSRCSSLKNITIPDSVTSIGSSAFYNCSSLKNITIPEKVTSIGNSTFYNCSSCLLFDFRKATQVPTLSATSAFDSTSSGKKIVVPDALYNSWKTATNWSSYASYIVKASEYVEA